jgi:copper chaperone
MNELVMKIDGMSCGHCVAAVRRALEEVAGVRVEAVAVGSARVAYDAAMVAPAAVVAAVEEAGYGARLEENEGEGVL